MRHREALWDEDFDYLFGESESRGWWGDTVAVESVTADEPAPEHRLNGEPWGDRDDEDGVNGVRSTNGEEGHIEFSTTTSGAAVTLGFDTRDVTPKHRPLPARRNKPALIVLSVAAAAIVLATLVVLLRGPADHPPATVPSVLPSTSASKAPDVLPALSGGQPIQPPPASLPPSPSAEQITPTRDQSYPYYPRSEQPSQTSAPRIDVTRAPMSVAPKPVTPPKTATPGQGSPHHGFF